MINIALKVKAKNGALQDFIDAKGWTQSDFARAMGISAQEAGTWFNMRSYPQTPEKMMRVSLLVDLPPEEIFPRLLMEIDWLTGEREWTFHKDLDMTLLGFEELKLLPAPDEDMDAFNLEETIEKALGMLTPGESRVIRMRMGLGGYRESTLEEIAKDLAVSRERVRQIEAKALHKMRKPEIAKGLKEFLYPSSSQDSPGRLLRRE